MGQYVSIKDDVTKQIVKGKTWTLLRFKVNGKNIENVVPNQDGFAEWAWYINVDTPNGASILKARFSRDPKGANDFTGQTFFDLTKATISSHTWFFKANKGQSVGVMVWHDGTRPLTVGTREIKLWIP